MSNTVLLGGGGVGGWGRPEGSRGSASAAQARWRHTSDKGVTGRAALGQHAAGRGRPALRQGMQGYLSNA